MFSTDTRPFVGVGSVGDTGTGSAGCVGSSQTNRPRETKTKEIYSFHGPSKGWIRVGDPGLPVVGPTTPAPHRAGVD